MLINDNCQTNVSTCFIAQIDKNQSASTQHKSHQMNELVIKNHPDVNENERLMFAFVFVFGNQAATNIAAAAESKVQTSNKHRFSGMRSFFWQPHSPGTISWFIIMSKCNADAKMNVSRACEMLDNVINKYGVRIN